MSNTPALEEVRRYWGLAVDIHRREERLAEFDALIESIRDEAWDDGAKWGMVAQGRIAEYIRQSPIGGNA